jgi:hypothetical protein
MTLGKRRFASEDVRAAALMLNFWSIGLALDGFFGLEARGFKPLADGRRVEEGEVHRDGLAPEFHRMKRLVAKVKSKQEQAGGRGEQRVVHVQRQLF